MARELLGIPSENPMAVLARLREALAGGAAVLPLAAGEPHAQPRHAQEATPTGSIQLPTRNAGSIAMPTPASADVADDVALVIETSGSTGMAKRVALSSGALVASVVATSAALGGNGRWLLALPVHYIAGVQVLTRSIIAGTEPVILGAGRFDAQHFAERLSDLGTDRRYTALVPAQLARIVEVAESDRWVLAQLRTLDAILVGGQATPAPLLERAGQLGLMVRRSYGSSETAGGCVYDGVPLDGVRVRSVGGEIQLAGPMLAEGYLGDDELTDRKFVHDAVGDTDTTWYRTADSGDVIDSRVTISGRLDNVIISGGIKVSLDRVERIVHSHPGWGSAVVVAQSDEQWGQRAVVVDTAERSIAEFDAILASVISGAGKAAAPARYVRVPELPLLRSGKTDRLTLARSLA